MQTGIGVIIEVEKVRWIAENPQYPAGERYVGQILTKADEVLDFATDIELPVDERDWKAIGRVDWDRGIVKISDHDE